MHKIMTAAVTVLCLTFSLPASLLALEVNDRLTIEGDLVGAYQHQSLDDADGYEDTGRGALTFQPAVQFQLTGRDVVYAKFGFAAGNGLNDGTAPFNLSPWAADLEADVKGIGGRDRDYLLTAWYGHTFTVGGDGGLTLVGGIIDATDYLDGNAYANDQNNQFMNTVLTNGPHAFLPSYDLGGAILFEKGAWSATAVAMSVAENEDGRSFNYFGVEGAYKTDFSIGEGNYRLNLNGTSDSFSSPDGDTDKPMHSILISCDQQLGSTFGVWTRLGWQDDEATINYKSLISAGLDIRGNAWSRDQDNIGLGAAYLEGGNSAIQESNVIELYYRLALNDVAALTLDFQYIYESLEDGAEPKGIISGLRFSAVF